MVNLGIHFHLNDGKWSRDSEPSPNSVLGLCFDVGNMFLICAIHGAEYASQIIQLFLHLRNNLSDCGLMDAKNSLKWLNEIFFQPYADKLL